MLASSRISNTLDEYKEPMPLGRKVSNFLVGINVRHPKPRAAVAHVEVSEELLEDLLLPVACLLLSPAS